MTDSSLALFVDCCCLSNNISWNFLDCRITSKVVSLKPVAYKLFVVRSWTSTYFVLRSIPEARAVWSKNFVTKYKAAYNMTPDQFAADGYDAIYIIKAAIEQAGITEISDGFNEALVAAMTQITVEGGTGSMQWTADGEPAKNATAVVI